MMNIVKKFKFNTFTYFLILVSLLSGFFKNILLILIIIIIHELGHVFFLKRYEYNIEEIEIYPFGGLTKVIKPINTPLKKEIKIAFAGVFFQVLLYFLFSILFYKDYIHLNTYQLFKTYNTTILIFNLLPIIPLDGSIILHSFLEMKFSYQTSYRIFLSISAMSLLCFFTYNYLWSLNNYMIVTFLFFKCYKAYKERKYLHNKFLLERIMYDFPYDKIKSHPYPDIDSIKKDTLHFFWNGQKYLHEKDFIKKRYQKKD